jgi:hypothetical protein
VNENTTNGARRAEDILPGGFVPSHLAKPMLRAASTTQLEYVAEGLLDISVASALLSGPIEDAANRHKLADDIHTESRRLYRLVKALSAGALGLAVLAGVVLSPVGGSTAQAAEAPQPDPVAAVSAPATVRVTLGAAPVTVWVRATVYTETSPGWFCASMWTARGRVSGTCSIGRTFPIPVTIDPRTFPVGRTFAQVVDDATGVAVSNVTIDARRPSRFGQGTWLDLGRGDEFVSAPLAAYTASVGAWTPQRYSPVQVQELVAGRWAVRATLTTTARGVASGVVHLGGGVHRVRVVRPAGATVWSTRGTTRTVVVTTEPLDVI